jgi:predicted kinase
MKRIALISIGVPGSGKTTALSALAQKHGIERISRDDIRQEWFGNPILQADKEAVAHEAHRRATDALKRGKSVLKDSTFVDPEKRQEAIAVVRSAGAERVIGIVFTTPLEVAKERNRNRDVQVEESVIEMMQAQLEENPPTLAEGFDVIYTDEQLDQLEDELADVG